MGVIFEYGRSHLIRHPSKNPFKVPFKNHFFDGRYSYPHNRDCECPALRIRVSCIEEAVLKGYLKGCLIE